MQKVHKMLHWLWKPARLFLGLGLLIGELLLTGAVCVWLFAGYIEEVSISIQLAHDLIECALGTLISTGIVVLIMQLVYWKDIKEPQ